MYCWLCCVRIQVHDIVSCESRVGGEERRGEERERREEEKVRKRDKGERKG